MSNLRTFKIQDGQYCEIHYCGQVGQPLTMESNLQLFKPGDGITQRMIDFANKCLMSHLLRDDPGTLYANLRDFVEVEYCEKNKSLVTFSVWTTALVDGITKQLVYGTLRFTKTVRGLRFVSEHLYFKEVC